LTPVMPGSGRRSADTAKEETTMAQAEFIEVQKALGGISYPATRDQLIKHAQGSNASKDILAVLQDIPDQEYDGPNEVSKAVAK
jgi:hypothetical protein